MWCLMEAVSGHNGITVSCILHIIQVYLKENTIRKRCLEHCTPHANGAPLYFTGLSYILKFYLFSICWQSVEEVAFSFILH